MTVLFDVFNWLILSGINELRFSFDRLSSFDLFLTAVYIKGSHQMHPGYSKNNNVTDMFSVLIETILLNAQNTFFG